MSPNVITEERFAEILAAYGADPERWPADERHAAEVLAATPQGQAQMAEAAQLDALLDSLPEVEMPAGLAAQLAAIPQQHRQEKPVGSGLIGWVTSGWAGFVPKAAGLAACAAFGLMLGTADMLLPSDGVSADDALTYAFGDYGLVEDI